MECKACELVARRDRGEAPVWDCIMRTDNWDVAHAFNSKLEGWLVLVTRRHVRTVAELTDAEAAELGPLAKRFSVALEQVTGCDKTYVVQFADQPEFRHVHVHVIPRHQAHAEAGPRVFELLGVDDPIPEPRMTEIADAIRAAL